MWGYRYWYRAIYSSKPSRKEGTVCGGKDYSASSGFRLKALGPKPFEFTRFRAEAVWDGKAPCTLIKDYAPNQTGTPALIHVKVPSNPKP